MAYEPDPSRQMGPDEFRKIREHLGRTQKSMADYLGVDIRTVRRWEAGHTAIPVYAGMLMNVEKSLSFKP